MKPRQKPLVRHSWIKRGTARLARSAIKRKPRPKPEQAAKFAREYGGESRHAWICTLECLACGRTPSVNAHTATGGMGKKAPAATIIPLCYEHHAELHQIGVRSFEAKHPWLLGRTLKEWATVYEARWQRCSADGFSPRRAS